MILALGACSSGSPTTAVPTTAAEATAAEAPASPPETTSDLGPPGTDHVPVLDALGNRTTLLPAGSDTPEILRTEVSLRVMELWCTPDVDCPAELRFRLKVRHLVDLETVLSPPETEITLPVRSDARSETVTVDAALPPLDRGRHCIVTIIETFELDGHNPEENREGIVGSTLVASVGDDPAERCPVGALPVPDIDLTTREPVSGCDVMPLIGGTEPAGAADSPASRFRGETIPADMVKIRVPVCEEDRVVFTTTEGEIELDDIALVPAGSGQGVNEFLRPRHYGRVRVVAVLVPALTGSEDDPFPVNVSPPFILRPAS